MTFDFVPSAEFYEILYENREFCEGIGKVMLSAGRLETNLRSYLKAKNIGGFTAKSTLGKLVSILKKNSLLTQNGEWHFDDLVLKRNYLAHSLYDLFSKVIDETILPRTELVEMDAEIFAEKAHLLAADFSHFAKIVSSSDIKKGILV